jgi:hypothetical protein
MAGAGEPQIDMRGRLELIRANRDLLDACPRHLFGPEVPGIEHGVGAMLGAKVKCNRCGGFMDLVALNYYVRGYEAAGKDGNDVLPGWREEKPGNGRTFFKPPEDA